MKYEPLNKLFLRLWRHISLRRRWQFGLLLMLMLIASFAEMVSIAAVIPFLGILTSPDTVFLNASAQPLIHALGIEDSSQLLLPLTICFCSAALIAGVVRLLLLWATTRISFATGADISMTIYHRTLYQPYLVHCSRNSSEVINGISRKSNDIIYSAIVPILTILSSGFMLFTILFALLFVDFVVALTAFGGFGLIYIFIIRLSQKQLMINSQCIAQESSNVIKSLQEGLGGIRDVLIDGSQSTYCQIFRNADWPLRHAQGNNFFIMSSPRFVLEALGMILIAVLAYSMAYQDDGIGKAIPVLGAIALGAQRLLPVMQQGYGAWSSIRGVQASLRDALDLLDQPLPSNFDQTDFPSLPYEKTIVLRQLWFRYRSDTPDVLAGLDLTIKKGSRVGFVGASGSGKSTLLDVLMGLLPPNSGSLEVDSVPITNLNNQAWKAHVSHVPQTIFLTDGTVSENIAFGIPKENIDEGRVRKAAQQAQIADSIEKWPNKYDSYVGERGIRLSGGQQQRIGIARALYKQSDVIIFDEATSALDSKTESAVMQTIENLSQDLTLLIVAHRVTTLRNCDYIVEISKGKIKRKYKYKEIVEEQ